MQGCACTGRVQQLAEGLLHPAGCKLRRACHPCAEPPPRAQEVEVKSCCCFGRGHCSATLDVDKDQYMPGEQCQLRLQVGAGRPWASC